MEPWSWIEFVVDGDEFEVLSVSEFCGETLIVVEVLKNEENLCVCGNWKESKEEDIKEACNASEEIDLLYMHYYFLF